MPLTSAGAASRRAFAVSARVAGSIEPPTAMTRPVAGADFDGCARMHRAREPFGDLQIEHQPRRIFDDERRAEAAHRAARLHIDGGDPAADRRAQRHHTAAVGIGLRENAAVFGDIDFCLAQRGARLVGAGARDNAFLGQLTGAARRGAGNLQLRLRARQRRAILDRLGGADAGERLTGDNRLALDDKQPYCDPVEWRGHRDPRIGGQRYGRRDRAKLGTAGGRRDCGRDAELLDLSGRQLARRHGRFAAVGRRRGPAARASAVDAAIRAFLSMAALCQASLTPA
mgnify:CR=1 FL=1